MDTILHVLLGIVILSLGVYGLLHLETIVQGFGDSVKKRSNKMGYVTPHDFNKSIFRTVFIFLMIFGVLFGFVGLKNIL